MANKWVETILGEVVEVKHGFAFPGEHFRDAPPGDILLTPGNFAIGGGFKGDKFKYFDGDVPDEYVLNEGDLIVTMTDLSKQSDTLGYPAFVPESSGPRFLHNQRLGKVLFKEGARLDKRFLFYLLCSTEYRNEVLASATGTTVKHTSPSRILAFKATIPEPSEQEAIGAVLGRLDEKIKLNRKISETLEAMARALFKSWFVDFDPVHAKAEGIETGIPTQFSAHFPSSFETYDFGQIPKGWSYVPLPDLIEVNPSRSMTKGNIAPYLDMGNVPTQGHSVNEVIQRPFSSGMRFINGDTLIARITPCLENGKTAFVDFLGENQVGWGSTEFIVLRPKPPLPNEFAYCLARSPKFRDFAIKSMTGTSGRQRVPAESLSHFRVVSPPKGIAELFGKLVRPMFSRSDEAAKENQCLRRQRDSLLPRLISGEIRLPTHGNFSGDVS